MGARADGSGYLNRLQHIAIPGVHIYSFKNPARVYQQCDMRIVEYVLSYDLVVWFWCGTESVAAALY